jgi:hypothetical protein
MDEEMSGLLFPPRPLQSVIAFYFSSWVTIVNHGANEEALTETVSQFGNDLQIPFLEFISVHIAEWPATDRGIIVVVGENLAGLIRNPETKEQGEAFAERFAILFLSEPIDHKCFFSLSLHISYFVTIIFS